MSLTSKSCSQKIENSTDGVALKGTSFIFYKTHQNSLFGSSNTESTFYEETLSFFLSFFLL